MNKKIFFFIFSLCSVLLHADSDTCYSLQFDSSNSPIKMENFPLDSKLIKIGKVYTVRFGCFDSFKNAKHELAKYKERYKDAMITSSYKWRFSTKINEHKKKPIEKKKIEKNLVNIGTVTVHPKSIKSNDLSSEQLQRKPIVRSVYKIDTLISMMLKDHPTIKAQKFAIQGADAQVKGAKWGYFPSLSLQVNQEFRQNKVWDGSVTLSQPLWTGGKLDAQYDIAVSNRNKFKSSLLESEYTLVNRLLATLEKYMTNRANAKAFLEGKERLNILKMMLSKRVGAGVSSNSDQSLLNTRIYQIETDIQQSNAIVQATLAEIILYTGHHFDNSLRIKSDIEYEFSSLESLIPEMEQTDPTLRKYNALIANAKAEKSKDKAALFPNVSVNVKQNFGNNNYYNSTPNDTRVYLSVGASLGSGLSILSKVNQAQAKVQQLLQEKLSAKQETINKMILAYNNYVSSSRRIKSQSQSIFSSQKVFESYKRLFLTGKRQWLDLVNASRELTQNQVSLNNIKVTRLISTYRLLLLSGTSAFQKGLK